MALITLGRKSLPTGSVLQVVQGSTSTSVTHSTSYADTGLSASITPTSTSNKILVMVNQHCKVQGGSGISLKLLRGSTALYTPVETYSFYIDLSNAHLRGHQSFNYLDTPSSTSALTYKTQGIIYNGSTSNQTQAGNRWTSFITLMEVAG